MTKTNPLNSSVLTEVRHIVEASNRYGNSVIQLAGAGVTQYLIIHLYAEGFRAGPLPQEVEDPDDDELMYIPWVIGRPCINQSVALFRGPQEQVTIWDANSPNQPRWYCVRGTNFMGDSIRPTYQLLKGDGEFWTDPPEAADVCGYAPGGLG